MTQRPTIREQLIDGGLQHIGTHGVADLSVRALAVAGGRSTMCVYSKFGSRNSLVQAIYDEATTSAYRALDKSGPDAFINSLRAFASDNAGAWQLLAVAPTALTGASDEQRETFFAELSAAYAESCGAEATSPQTRLVIAAMVGLLATASATDDPAWSRLTDLVRADNL